MHLVSNVPAQSTLTNGWTTPGNIASPGQTDTWTFSANAGDAIVLRVGKILTNGFAPKLQLQTPASVIQATAVGSAVAEVAVTATNSGTFSVIVSDNAGTQTNEYRLTLAKTGDPVFVSPGDEGGPMTNGWMHLGNIDLGDLDVWTFNANTGEALVVRVGKTNASANLGPWVRLYGPSGALLGSSASGAAAEVAVSATNSGTYLVVIGDGNVGLGGTGEYRLTLAKTGVPVFVSPADEGGPMTNGWMHLGNIDVGDLDVWTFNANVGDALIVRGGKTNASANLGIWVRLYGPNGLRLGTASSGEAAEVAVPATDSGTYLVVIGDGNVGLGGSGEYQLTLAKTGAPVYVAPGDEGGPLTNGWMHLGNLDVGDLDLWTFSANAGDALVVRAGKTNASANLGTWVRLYGPSGALLGSASSGAAAEVAVSATNSGTYLVVIGDGNVGLGGTGEYRLTLAKTGEPVFVSPGDEGGPLTGAGIYYGNIDVGDLDVWSFDACAGDVLVLQMTRTNTTTLAPWLRLYGRNGVLLNSVAATPGAQLTRVATNSGNFLAVLGDGNVGLGGSGPYTLTANGLTSGLKLCLPVISGSKLSLDGIGGEPGTNFVLFTATNITTPAHLWTPVQTNQFDQFGVLTYTNQSNPAEPQRYFRLLEQ